MKYKNLKIYDKSSTCSIQYQKKIMIERSKLTIIFQQKNVNKVKFQQKILSLTIIISRMLLKMIDQKNRTYGATTPQSILQPF